MAHEAHENWSTRMKTLISLLIVLGCTACGRPFDITTPAGFIELDDQQPQFAYRATDANGVVSGVRVIEAEEREDLEFWEQAVSLRLQQVSGYELDITEEQLSADGSAGVRLRFRRKEHGATYVYWVTLFAAQERIFVLEVGGEEQHVKAAEAQLLAQLDGFAARCSSLVSPVLASRTCNRW